MQESNGLFNCSRSPPPQKQCSCIDRGESHMVRIPATKSTTYHTTLFEMTKEAANTNAI